MLDKGSPEVAELLAALRAVTPRQEPWVKAMLVRELRLLLPKDKWSALAGLSYGALCALLCVYVGTPTGLTVVATLAASLVSTRIANDDAVREACGIMGAKVGAGAARAYTWVGGIFSRKGKAQ